MIKMMEVFGDTFIDAEEYLKKLADENELHSKVPNSPMNKRNYLRSPGAGGQTDTNLLIEIPV